MDVVFWRILGVLFVLRALYYIFARWAPILDELIADWFDPK